MPSRDVLKFAFYFHPLEKAELWIVRLYRFPTRIDACLVWFGLFRLVSGAGTCRRVPLLSSVRLRRPPISTEPDHAGCKAGGP